MRHLPYHNIGTFDPFKYLDIVKIDFIFFIPGRQFLASKQQSEDLFKKK